MEILAQEYFKIVDVISIYDGHLMAIKGWSITVGMALIGYSFQQKQKMILLLCCTSSICFALVDAKFKQYQTSYYPRMREIEICINTEKASCPVLQIDRSWVSSKSQNGYIQQFGKVNVLMPHFILFLLSIFLFFKPKIIEQDFQLKH